MKKKTINKKSLQGQRGISLVLLALMAVVIFGLLGLVIAVSSLFSSHARQQDNSNLAAYAAIEAFMRDETPNTLTDRISRAKAAVDTILEKNRLLYFSGTYNPTTVWNGTYATDTPELQFGVWFDSAPNTCPLPAALKTDELTGCDCTNFSLEAIEGKPFKNAPCFIPYTETEMSVAQTPPNAVRALIRTPDNSIIAPYASMIAKGVSNKTQINAPSIAATVERCTVFLVDVSNSSFGMSHNHYRLRHDWVNPISMNGDGTWLIDRKYDPAPPTPTPIPGNYAILAPTTNPSSMYDCSSLPSPPLPSMPAAVNQGTETLWAEKDAQIYWCAMKAVRPPTCTDPNIVNSTCDKHYQSDYEVEDTVDGFLAIDKFRNPEPLTSIYIAVNSSLRALAAKATSMDKVAIVPFADRIYGPIPATGLSRDLDLMIDLTDMRRAGKRVYNTVTGLWETVGEEHPNYIDRGWSPVGIAFLAFGQANEAMRPKKGTDLLGALHHGINRISDPTFCAKTARKTLVLASDGLMTIHYPITGTTVDWANPQSILKTTDLTKAEDVLYADTSLPQNILKRLIDNEIHFVPMLVGDAVEPNFANVPKPSIPPTPSAIQNCYAKLSNADGSLDSNYSIIELAANGYRGIPNTSASPPEYNLTNNTNNVPAYPTGPNAPTLPRVCDPGDTSYDLYVCASQSLSFMDGIKARKPNGWLSQLAILSQGYYCPINEPYRVSYPNGPIDASCYDTSCGLYSPFTSDPTPCDEQNSRYWKSGSPVQCDRTTPFQTTSIYGDEMGGQAARCLTIALGAPPYYLAVDEPF